MSVAGLVVILTHRFDPTADKVIDELNRRGVPLFRCDEADFPEKLSAEAELLDGHWSGQLQTARHRVDLEDITGIYYRRPTAFEFHPDLSDDEFRWAAIQERIGIRGSAGVLGPVVEPPAPDRLRRVQTGSAPAGGGVRSAGAAYPGHERSADRASVRVRCGPCRL